MECNPELLSAFLDDELDPETNAKLIEHLLECEECQQLLAKLSQARVALSDSPTLFECEPMVNQIMGPITNQIVSDIPLDPSLDDLDDDELEALSINRSSILLEKSTACM
ncbi:MAG: zf-HC2 domain-containing protein [Magnetococcales bacterium]|nr:zf-HC2 domain-containing protein [Magnetococcales bacterium]